MTTYYIGADVHNNSTELAIEKRNKIVARYTVPTTIPAISNVLDPLQGKKYLTMEEGPMAGWLYRNPRCVRSETFWPNSSSIFCEVRAKLSSTANKQQVLAKPGLICSLPKPLVTSYGVKLERQPWQL